MAPLCADPATEGTTIAPFLTVESFVVAAGLTPGICVPWALPGLPPGADVAIHSVRGVGYFIPKAEKDGLGQE
jgi:hypothetical protein